MSNVVQAPFFFYLKYITISKYYFYIYFIQIITCFSCNSPSQTSHFVLFPFLLFSYFPPVAKADPAGEIKKLEPKVWWQGVFNSLEPPQWLPLWASRLPLPLLTSRNTFPPDPLQVPACGHWEHAAGWQVRTITRGYFPWSTYATTLSTENNPSYKKLGELGYLYIYYLLLDIYA